MKKQILSQCILGIILLSMLLPSCVNSIISEDLDSNETEPEMVGVSEKAENIPDTGEIPKTTLNDYIWNDINMFFGWSIIGKDKIEYVKDLDMTWASLQPHVIWFEIETQRGVYDWSKLDEEIKWLQELDVDITLVYSTFCNTFDDNVRYQIKEELLELVKQPDIATLSDAWITWNRDLKGPQKYNLEPDPFDETDPMMKNLEMFTQALTERYDGDGIDDWEGLNYPLRVHHIVEEWPSPGLNAKTYLGYLTRLSKAIKTADPNAQVMIPGLYMPNWGRIFAYLDGHIDDPDAGIIDGKRYSKDELRQMDSIIYAKAGYENILKLGKDYFDLVDIHLYTEDESFYEGEIEYVLSKMREFGYEKPVWCVEGGGPFRNPEFNPNDPQGDAVFGTTNEKEVAEYVVKYHTMSAAKGLVRQHWGIGGQKDYGYWGGPWNIMGLVEKVTERKRPAYYTYKLMREKLRDFETGKVNDLSTGMIKVFEFKTPNGSVFVAWNSAGRTVQTDLTSIIACSKVKVTGIVTELKPDNSPVLPGVIHCRVDNIPMGISPVFIEPEDTD